MITTKKSYLFLVVFFLSHAYIDAINMPRIVDSLHQNKKRKLIDSHKEYEFQREKQMLRSKEKSRQIQRNQQRQYKFRLS